jgi:hypothetical protein
MKSSLIPAAILSVCLMAMGLSAQTRNTTIQITDGSLAESPLRVIGNVSLDEQTFADKLVVRDALDAVLTNVSSKTIIAYEVVLDVFPGQGGGSHEQYTDDRFFGNEIQPGSQYLLQQTHGRSQVIPLSDVTRVLRPAQAQARVVFVEFADGSKFGASKWAAGLSTERMHAVTRLNGFLKAYENGGDTPLADALANSLGAQSSDDTFGTDASLVANHVKSILDSKGSGAAVAEIHRFLDNANQRKSIM